MIYLTVYYSYPFICLNYALHLCLFNDHMTSIGGCIHLCFLYFLMCFCALCSKYIKSFSCKLSCTVCNKHFHSHCVPNIMKTDVEYFFLNLKLFYYIKTNKQHITTIQHKHKTRHIKKNNKKHSDTPQTLKQKHLTAHNVYLELILYSAKNATYPSGHVTCFLIWRFFSRSFQDYSSLL